MQIWCARVTQNYSSVDVSDLAASFRNGLAFVGIIHHFRPDLIANPDSLDANDILGNNNLAYKVAEEKLGIPSLLEAEDMLESEEPDKFSVVTYLAQFYHQFKNDEKNVSPNVSLHLSSESETDSPLGTPTSNKKLFEENQKNSSLRSPTTPPAPVVIDQKALMEKYGAEIFNNDASTKKLSPPTEEDEGVVVNMPVRPQTRSHAHFKPRTRIGGVASMCKDFELKAKVSEKQHS